MNIPARILTLTTLLVLSLLLAACASAPAESVAPLDEPVNATEPQAPTAAPEADAPAEEPEAAEETEEASEPAVVVSGGVSFQNDILPILERSCIRCHGGNRTEDGLDVRSYASLMSGSENGAVIVPGDADGSELIVQVITGEMPRRAPKLEAEKIQLLVDWVNQGAQDN